MPRLKVFSGQALCALLAIHGFSAVRQRGSHCVMQKKSGDGTITVPVPMHREVRIGTLQSIIRQSRVPRAEFLDRE